MTTIPLDEFSGDDVIFCIPIYNDWESARVLLSGIDSAVATMNCTAVSVLFVDDGSADEECLSSQSMPFEHLRQVEVLRLRRNVGHQRAIAIGLTYLHASRTCRRVCVMDGDGDDAPRDVPRLMAECERQGGQTIVFAARNRRSEGLIFRLFYRLFQVLHLLLTGRRVDVGNFSVIPSQLLGRLVGGAELWNHYAATVFKLRLPTSAIPIDRGERFRGRSKMSFVSLVIHGLSAISVFSDVVGVRMLMLSAATALLSAIGIAVVVAIRFFTELAIPGWATTAAGLLLVVQLNSVLLSTVFVLAILQSRNSASFLPLRDYEHYIMGIQMVFPVQQFPDGLSPRGFWGSERSEEGFARTMGLVRLALS
jgi:hypothetical protein